VKPPGGNLARSGLRRGETRLARTGFRPGPGYSSFAPRQPWSNAVPLLAGETQGKGKSAARTGGGSGGLIAPAPPEFTPRVKLLVRRRAGRGDIFDALCEACGAWLGEHGGEFQHRAARGAGGCRDAVINGPANAALLCGSALLRTGCHGACERRSAHMGMDAAGFWLEHGTTPDYDPRRVPVLLHGRDGGLKVWLAADGRGDDGSGYLYQRPESGAALCPTRSPRLTR
jgi:hypothetical protein